MGLSNHLVRATVAAATMCTGRRVTARALNRGTLGAEVGLTRFGGLFNYAA